MPALYLLAALLATASADCIADGSCTDIVQEQLDDVNINEQQLDDVQELLQITLENSALQKATKQHRQEGIDLQKKAVQKTRKEHQHERGDFQTEAQRTTKEEQEHEDDEVEDLEEEEEEPPSLEEEAIIVNRTNSRVLTQTLWTEDFPCYGEDDKQAFWNRLDTLGTSSISGGADTVFPASADSIGDIGRFESDPDADYSQWAQVGDIAAAAGEIFKLWDESAGPVYTDVQQGHSGTCYLLAALQAVAHTVPDVIRNMFVDQSVNAGSAAYEVTMDFAGRKVQVAVDNMLPTGAAGSTSLVFARAVNGHFWAPLIQKAYAKMYGSYSLIEGSDTRLALKHITRAPISSVKNGDSNWNAETVYGLLSQATTKPCTLSTGSGSTCGSGLPCTHAYSVLGTEDSYMGHSQVVKVMNPWGNNDGGYNGVLASDSDNTADGWFYMTLEEVLSSTNKVMCAMTQPNAVVSTYQNFYDEGSAEPLFMEFTLGAPATVELARTFTFGCDGISATISFFHGRTASDSKEFVSDSTEDYEGSGRATKWNSFRFDLPAGDHQLYLQQYVLKQNGNVLPKSSEPVFSITAYSTQEVDLTPKCIDRPSKFGGSGQEQSDGSKTCDWMAKYNKCGHSGRDGSRRRMGPDHDTKYYYATADGYSPKDHSIYRNCQATCKTAGRGCSLAMMNNVNCNVGDFAKYGYSAIGGESTNDCWDVVGALGIDGRNGNPNWIPEGEYTYCSSSAAGGCQIYGGGYLQYCPKGGRRRSSCPPAPADCVPMEATAQRRRGSFPNAFLFCEKDVPDTVHYTPR